jgi:signal transduction histidine kinase
MSSAHDLVRELTRATPRSRMLVTVALLLAVAGIGVIDYATGPLPSLSVFYLVPVSAGAVLLGRRMGFVVAAVCGATSLVCDVVFVGRYPHRAVSAWNAALMAITLMFLVEVLTRLRQRTLDAVQAEERSREFLGFAAHQLRTPIAGLRSGVDALAVTDDSDLERDALLSGLARDAERAARLITSLLRVARLDEHEPMPMRAADLASAAHVEIERASMRHPAISWELRAAGDADTVTMCNPDALGEAIANLLDNAGRHARERVTLSMRQTESAIEIDITDDGDGLSRAVMDSAFDRFVSLDGFGGSGLGLPIARGICEAHGGTLRYQGGSFAMSIPRRPMKTRVGAVTTRGAR